MKIYLYFLELCETPTPPLLSGPYPYQSSPPFYGKCPTPPLSNFFEKAVPPFLKEGFFISFFTSLNPVQETMAQENR